MWLVLPEDVHCSDWNYDKCDILKYFMSHMDFEYFFMFYISCELKKKPLLSTHVNLVEKQECLIGRTGDWNNFILELTAGMTIFLDCS